MERLNFKNQYIDGHSKVLITLANAGADLDLQNRDQETAISFAAARKCVLVCDNP